MLNHISIAVNEPERVANVLAEMWNGMVLPFPPAPNSFFVLANDGRGSAIEVTPAGTVLQPGEGTPEDDQPAATEYGAQFVKSDLIPKYVATHLNISSKLTIEEIKSIGNREGWRTLLCDREGLFQLMEVWIEDMFLLEVMTPEQTARYVEITSPEFLATIFGDSIPGDNSNASVENLNVIG